MSPLDWNSFLLVLDWLRIPPDSKLCKRWLKILWVSQFFFVFFFKFDEEFRRIFFVEFFQMLMIRSIFPKDSYCVGSKILVPGCSNLLQSPVQSLKYRRASHPWNDPSITWKNKTKTDKQINKIKNQTPKIDSSLLKKKVLPLCLSSVKCNKLNNPG